MVQTILFQYVIGEPWKVVYLQRQKTMLCNSSIKAHVYAINIGLSQSIAKNQSESLYLSFYYR